MKTYKLSKSFRVGKQVLRKGDEIQLSDKQAKAFKDFIHQDTDEVSVATKHLSKKERKALKVVETETDGANGEETDEIPPFGEDTLPSGQKPSGPPK